MPPSDTSTGSLKRSFTSGGDLSYTAPFCGSVDSSDACANAGAAPITTRVTTSAATARRRLVIRPLFIKRAERCEARAG